MKRFAATLLRIGMTAPAGVSAQAPSLVKEVRTAIAANDFAEAAETLAAYRADHGVTPEMLEALSWMGRGATACAGLHR